MSAETPPQPLAEHRDRIRSRLASALGLLCCLDFDGTLAPIVDDPDAATPTAANEAAVAQLASAPSVSTAIISGRALTDVRSRIDGPTTYAGNHGLELARDDTVAVHPIARKRATQLERVCTTLETVLEPIPNTRIENKRLTGTVHLSTVPAACQPIVTRQTHAVVNTLGADRLEISSGKRILEIGPSIPWGKGNAVGLLASALPPETLSLYIGDDVTDESAFEVVEPDGIGIRVGDGAPSAASYRLSAPADVASFLEWLGSVGVSQLDAAPSDDTARTTCSRGSSDAQC